MGQTLLNLSKNKVEPKTIFNNRFVVEICEQVHVHYRNLRILMSLTDWVEFAKGNADALKRWESRGCPVPAEGTHIELCRKEVAKSSPANDEITINLNRNLYKVNEGRIFSEGADLEGKDYIHLKIRDLRIEMTKEEFLALSDACIEAKEKLTCLA